MSRMAEIDAELRFDWIETGPLTWKHHSGGYLLHVHDDGQAVIFVGGAAIMTGTLESVLWNFMQAEAA